MSFEIRKATIDDVDDVVPLARAMYHAAELNKHSEWKAENAKNFLSACVSGEGSDCLIAVDDDGLPVSFMTVVAVPSFWDPCYIVCQELSLWVVPEHRKSGVGSQMIESMVEWAKDKECKIANLCSFQAMEPKKVATMYRKHGFELLEKAFSRSV